MAERNIPSSGEEKPLSGLLSQAPERAILIGVDMPGNGWPAEESLDELAQLATPAGVTCVDRVIQRLARPHPGTLLGSGKIQEIAELVRFHNCDAVIFDLELPPGQHRTLESELETQVLDRTALILMTSPATRTSSHFENAGCRGGLEDERTRKEWRQRSGSACMAARFHALGSKSPLISHFGDEGDAFVIDEGVS
jgi:hypothetical protein